ncbi:MAG: NUDIX hydrolase [Acidimicrobiia bacterium]|nr:NUDIX hydrolase [Acidimicrobiia bacterium]
MTLIEKPPKQSIWAAGCVVTRAGADDEPEYLVVHRPQYEDWSLPKGKLDDDERFLDGALREVREETGVHGIEPRFIGTVGYMTKSGNPKVVRWWLTKPKKPHKDRFKPNGEVDEVRWLDFENAAEILQYRNDRAVLERANDMVHNRSAGTVHLVRHAHAGVRDTTNPDDANRPIDKLGKKQRKAIRRDLLDHPVTRIGSSQLERCVQTVQKLADTIGVPVEREIALAEGTHPTRIVALIHELQQEAAVLCSHGDVIAGLIGHLFAEGIPMDGPMEWEKGSIWHLRTVKGRIVSGAYTPPGA